MVTPSSRKLLKAGARISKRWWPHVRRPFAARSIVPAQGIGPGFHRRTGRIQRLASNEQQEGFVMTKAVDGWVQAAALNATDPIDLEVSP